jgi:hypothetical protein
MAQLIIIIDQNDQLNVYPMPVTDVGGGVVHARVQLDRPFAADELELHTKTVLQMLQGALRDGAS